MGLGQIDAVKVRVHLSQPLDRSRAVQLDGDDFIAETPAILRELADIGPSGPIGVARRAVISKRLRSYRGAVAIIRKGRGQAVAQPHHHYVADAVANARPA